MKENTNEKSDTLAAIGIGAMIVFIALILVAAVAAAVIIQTAEKLQQNAQTTGADASDMLSTKIIIISVVIPVVNELYITFELAPGSNDIPPVNVEWSIICANGVDYGTFAQASLVGTAALVTATGNGQLVIDTTYDLQLRNAAGGIQNCLPTASASHTLLIQSVSGGFTEETLDYSSDVSPGEMVY